MFQLFFNMQRRAEKRVSTTNWPMWMRKVKNINFLHKLYLLAETSQHVAGLRVLSECLGKALCYMKSTL